MSRDDGRSVIPPASGPSAESPRADKPGDKPADDARAKDILGERPVRAPLGDRLSQRVGVRRWERAPIVSCTGKLFARYDLADPWDPDGQDRPVNLGPVGMRFEEMRQPAPHATVKESKPKTDKPAWTPPKGILDARAATPAKPAVPAPKAKRAAPQPPRPAPEAAAPAPLPPLAPPPRGKIQKNHSSGRFRMRPTSSSGPKVRQVPKVVEQREGSVSERQPEPPATPPPAPQSLDDLFGSLGAGGRDKRVGRKKD